MQENILTNWEIQQGNFPSLFFQGVLDEALEVENMLLSCFDDAPLRKEASALFVEMFSGESFDSEPWSLSFRNKDSLHDELNVQCFDRAYLAALAMRYTAKRESLLAFIGKSSRHRFLISQGSIVKDWIEVPYTNVNPANWI